MQAPQPQYHGSVGQTNYIGPDISQNTPHNYPGSYHSPYPNEIHQQYQPVNHPPPYNGHQMPYNSPSYRPPMSHDMYGPRQQYNRCNNSNGAWDREAAQPQSFGPPSHLVQNGHNRNNALHMPPPPHHFAHHQQLTVSSPSHSPRSWPGSIPQQSPRATPSPMAAQSIPSPSLSNRSPVPGKRYSPSPAAPSVNQNFEFSSHQPANPSSSPQNQMPSSAPSPSAQPFVSNNATVDSNDPLQSLQKMVMIEPPQEESSIDHSNYGPSNVHLHPAAALKGVPEFSNLEHLVSNDEADSPGPIYYNMDDGKTVNSKVILEDSSQGSFSSEQRGREHLYPNGPQMEPMRYSNTPDGIPVAAATNSYHPMHHNGFTPEMFQAGPYCNNSTYPQQKSPRRKPKKDDFELNDGSSPGRKKKKGKAACPVEVYNPNCLSNGLHQDYQTVNYEVGAANQPQMSPAVTPKKRAYTKRAKVSPADKPTQGSKLSETSSADSNVSEIVPTKRKYKPRKKFNQLFDNENTVNVCENLSVNGCISPAPQSISSLDGPVKITKVPNIISNDKNLGEKTIKKEEMVPAIRKTPILREVSVKIVPISSENESIMVNYGNSVKCESVVDSESITNSPCSSNTSVVPVNTKESVKDVMDNDSSSQSVFLDVTKKKRGRPKRSTDSNGFVQPKKNKMKIQPEDHKGGDSRKNDEKSRTSLGPYLHIEGSHDSPSSIIIINNSSKEDDKKYAKQNQKKVHHKHFPSSSCPKRKFGHSSTLSASYDTLTKDKSWLCVFCHKGSHCDDLGDLFGPYFHSSLQFSTSTTCTSITKSNSVAECENVSPNQKLSMRTRRMRSDSNGVESSFQNKSVKQGNNKDGSLVNDSSSCPSLNADQTTCKSASTNLTHPPSSPIDNSQHEFWFHEDCIVWANGVYIINHKLIGVDEAVNLASKTHCTYCDLNGATLGCLVKNCPERLHFLCAKEKDCLLDPENFSLRCPQHKIVLIRERS